MTPTPDAVLLQHEAEYRAAEALFQSLSLDFNETERAYWSECDRLKEARAWSRDHEQNAKLRTGHELAEAKRHAALAAMRTIAVRIMDARAESLAGVAVKLRVLWAVVGEGPGILENGLMRPPATMPDAEGFEALKPEYLLFRMVEDCRAAGLKL